MANTDSTFHKELEIKTNMQLRELMKDLPDSVSDYMRAIATSTSPLTRLAYGYDLRIFFHFLTTERLEFSGRKPKELTIDDMARLTLKDIEVYQEYLATYVKPTFDEDEQPRENPDYVINEELGISRKLSALRSFYKYLYTHEYIPENVTEKIRMPKIKEKPVIYLDRNEVAKMLDTISTGEGLSSRQQKFVEHSRVRDLAMIMLLVGTGIRESELVGMDISDVDLDEEAFVVTRKGGNQMILYFNDNIRDALGDYMAIREGIEPLPGHEQALFLSSQRRRITTRAVQNLVKKYATVAAPLKRKLSPHKLRSTYATTLYRNTGDIYQVSKTLGHKNVSTTKRYTQESEDSNRQASKHVDWV